MVFYTIVCCLGISLLGINLAAARVKSASTIRGNQKVLGFVLGRSTLGDVQAELGRSVVRKYLRDEDAPDEVCYKASGDDRTKIVFEAGFSGSWKQLDGFKVINDDLFKERAICSESPLVNKSIHTESGLRLGMTRKQVLDLLGAPNQGRGDSIQFEWQSRQEMTAQQKDAAQKTFKSPVTEPYFDVVDSVAVHFAHNMVIEFEVRHIVTY